MERARRLLPGPSNAIVYCIHGSIPTIWRVDRPTFHVQTGALQRFCINGFFFCCGWSSGVAGKNSLNARKFVSRSVQLFVLLLAQRRRASKMRYRRHIPRIERFPPHARKPSLWQTLPLQNEGHAIAWRETRPERNSCAQTLPSKSTQPSCGERKSPERNMGASAASCPCRFTLPPPPVLCFDRTPVQVLERRGSGTVRAAC